MAILQDEIHLLKEITSHLFQSRCIMFWSRYCIDNARVQHSVKSPPAHPKDSEGSIHVWKCSSQLFFHNLSLMNVDIVILEYGYDVSMETLPSSQTCNEKIL